MAVLFLEKGDGPIFERQVKTILEKQQ